MSSRMVELAADMASAKNVPLDVALDKIRAGLIGESEPLRTMGVLLSEARVKQEAYSSGLAKTGATLTNTQKVQARMNIILADSAAMHGDLINTQGSVANQWRAIKQHALFDVATEAFGAEGAQRMVHRDPMLGQLDSRLGSDLGVALENTVGSLDSADKFGSKDLWVNVLAVLKNKIGAAVPPEALQAFGSIALLMGTLGPLIASINIKTIAMSVASKVATAAQWLLNVAMNANPIGLVIAAIGLLVGAWVLWGDEIKGFMRAVWAKMLDKIGSGLKMLSKFVGIFNDDWAAAMKAAGEGLQDTADNMGKAEKATAKLSKKQEATTRRRNAGTEKRRSRRRTRSRRRRSAKKATKEQIKAAKAAKKSAEAVQGLLDGGREPRSRAANF